MSGKEKKNYVLKDNEDEEFIRLGFQHQVWQEETVGVWKRAGFGLGQTLLDLGCGPGYLSFDLSRLVGNQGRIIAVDNSEKFINHIRNKIDHGEYQNISAEIVDIKTMELEPESVDGAIARWVLMFIFNPDAVMERVARALKPNGVFAIMDYFQFRSMSLWPKSIAFEKVYHAVYKLIRKHGGDADVGGWMPQILNRHGLKVIDMYPIFRIGTPGSLLWQWLEMTAKNHDNLLESGLLMQGELEEYYHDWSERAKNPNSFFTAPPVLVTIGKKR